MAIGRTHATVSFNRNPSRPNLQENLRTRYTYFVGVAGNSDLCIQEVNLHTEIRSRCEYMKLTSTEEEAENESEEKDFSENEDGCEARGPV